MEPLNVENPTNQPDTSSKTHIIIYIILGLIIVGLIIGLVLVIISKDKEKEKEVIKEVEKQVIVPYLYTVPNIDENLFGEIQRNITYYNKEGKINNTFGTNGAHYIEQVGNVHNGTDYNKTEANNYDLYIPSQALKNKEGHNGIFLFIHGGAWVGGYKLEMDKFFVSYGQMGYITANMEYTLLALNSPETNIFRIVDEITACISNIKEQLVNRSFIGDNLELAIFGYSAGAHLTLLYSYLIADSPIKIKFTVDISGPISLERQYNLMLKEVNDTLPNLTKSYIEDFQEQGRLKDTLFRKNETLLILNCFLGFKYSYNELMEMLIINGSEMSINYTNEKYKELINITSYGFPLYIVDNNRVPVLCYYSGNDQVVGVSAFAYLEDKAINDSKPIELIYSKYSDHNFYDFSMEDSVEHLRELNLKIIEYSKKYFTQE